MKHTRMKKTRAMATAIGLPLVALTIVLGVLAGMPAQAAPHSFQSSFEILWVDLGLDHTRWALDRLGLTYTRVAVGDFGSVNLNDYDVLFVGSTSGSVPDDVFQPLLDRKMDIAAFVQDGGGLVALSNGGDWGDHSTSLDWAWVPITLTIGSRTYRTHIISPTHSLVEGLTDASFFYWWGAHGEAFEAWEWPEATSVVQAAQEGHSALLAGPYGVGRMVLTGMFLDVESYGDPALEVLLKWAAGALPDAPPQVARAYPVPGGWAAMNTRLRLTFDQLINPTAVTDGVLTVVADSGPVAGTLTLLPDIAQILFTPAVPLMPGEEVTATLAATVADWNGNPLDGNGDGTGGDAYTWHFTVRARTLLTVTNSDDNGPGTLRQALEDALPGDIITFDPAVFSPSAPVTITWQGGLPILDDGYVTLDASDTGVFLDGSQAGEWNGLNITSDGNVIHGLTLANVEGPCLFLKEGAAFNIIGGDRTLGAGPNGQGNTIGRCRNPGIAVQHGGTVSNTFLGNYLGTDPTGTIAWPTGEGWGAGILIGEGADYTTIGSNVPGERNLLSGNARDGLQIGGSYYATVLNNYLGTDASGTAALPNQDCGLDLEIGSRYCRFEGNVFSGNDYCGAQTDDPGTGYNEFIGNYFGVNAAGTDPLPNSWDGLVIFDNVEQTLIEGNVFAGGNGSGINLRGMNNVVRGNYIGTNPTETAIWGFQRDGIDVFGYQYGESDQDSVNNMIEDNIIAHNQGRGIVVRSMYDGRVEGNTISHNSIYSNTGPGIELVGGVNAYIFPSIFTEVSSTTVKGVAMPNVTVEVFSDLGDEGRWYEGTVIAGADGSFTFTKTSGFTGPNVTATATDIKGNTSEFTSPYAPNRDVLVAAIYVPQLRQQLSESLTPLVRVGNGGTTPEIFTIIAVITHAGARVYEDQQTVTDLGVMQYRTLDFTAWTPTAVGDYTFEVTVQPSPPDDDLTNDRLTLDFQVVDARYDLWSRDNPTDDGREPSVGPVWQSPDLWVRNTADGLTEHQDPINNITNTVYVRVRNRGTLTATDATVTVYWHPPALVIGQSWWEPIGTAVVGEVTPGAVHTVEMDWLPQITGVLTEPYHTCLIDVISSTQDPAPLQWDVRGSNNIEQRNVDIISSTTTTSLYAASSTTVSMTFSVGNPYASEQLADVIVDATGVPAGSEVHLDLGELFERWQRFGQDSLEGATVISGTTQVALSGGGQAVIGGLPLAGEELIEVVLEVSGLNGRRGEIDVSERIGDEVLGGVSLHVVGQAEIFLPLVLCNFSP